MRPLCWRFTGWSMMRRKATTRSGLMPIISAISSGVGTGLLITICSMKLVYDESSLRKRENSIWQLAIAGRGGKEPKGHGDSVMGGG